MKKILIAHDGSKYSHKALKMAVDMAVRLGSSIIVLSVIPDLHLTELSPLDQERLQEALEEETRKNLEKAKAVPKKQDLPVKTVIRQGNAAEVIIETAKKMRVGLIVIGSHGRHGMERFLLGSVSANVVEHADRPVMVVK
jgi:nucleotide-binding universal stress UspA family protein